MLRQHGCFFSPHRGAGRIRVISLCLAAAVQLSALSVELRVFV